MTANDPLAHELTSLTSWSGNPVEPWRAALNIARPQRGVRGLLSARIPNTLAALAVTIILIGLVAVMLPSMGKARSSNRLGRVTVSSQLADASVPPPLAGFAYGYQPPVGGRLQEGWASADADVPATTQPAASSPDRQVIRKATIELKTPDVRSAFLKAAMVLSEANSEYMEQSSLTGQDTSLQASLTLRVAASRLSQVLTQLRELGVVTSETAGGEDVTDQIVDIEARLRNEQRVETELLSLLESRNDAPLKEILDLRESINQVREQIERMTAQRDRLGRLVSLATILVIIRADDAPVPVIKEQSTLDYLIEQVDAAWETSLRHLSDSLAFLIRTLVGGLLWWALALAAYVAIRAAFKRAARRAAQEPAPTL